MSLPLPKFREVVFQLLYAQVVGGAEPEHLIELLSAELEISSTFVRQAQVRVEKVLALKDEIDRLIGETSRDYSLDRIQTVEQNIIRLGVYELLHDDDIPPKVAISEAIRLAKKFSTAEASMFVNALLDQLYVPESAAL